MRRGPRREQMPMLHRFSFLRLCFLVWAPSSRQATADAWREGQWRPSPLARSRVVFLRLCGKGGREREKSNKARKKRKKRKKHSDIKPEGGRRAKGEKKLGGLRSLSAPRPSLFSSFSHRPSPWKKKKKSFLSFAKKRSNNAVRQLPGRRDADLVRARGRAQGGGEWRSRGRSGGVAFCVVAARRRRQQQHQR